LLLLASAATAFAVAGCKHDDGPNASGVNAGDVLGPSTLSTAGGAALDPGGRGAPAGHIDVATTGPLSFGAALATPADVPAAPADATRVTTLDSDVAGSGSVVLDGNITVSADGSRRVTVSGGDLFVSAKIRATGGAPDRSLSFEAPNGTIYVTGTIDASGADGQPGGTIVMSAARVVVTGTLATAGGTGGGRAGDLRVTAEGDVLLLGSIRARGGAASASSASDAGAAGALAIEAGGNVQLAGTVDLRGGSAPVANFAGGAGGHLAIGATRPPAAVTFALDVWLDGGDGHAGAGAGGNLTAVVGGDFMLAGLVRSRGGSITAGGAGDGGPAGNFTLDINTIVGHQVYRPEGVILLDGGDSGGAGTAGGGGHLYARCFDGAVTMSGSLFARGGAARDPGGVGGLGGHVNIFSDSNHDGVGGNLTVTPEGVIDASGGAGSVGGAARNDGTPEVATFPDNQEMIAVLLNADGIHGTPVNGIIDNQGTIIARGGVTGGTGGDIAFHGEGTGGLHDPLGGSLDMAGDGAGPTGQFASE
jgi:hypothetical protein